MSQRDVVLVAGPGVQLLDVVGPAEVLAAASALAPDAPPYRVRIATRDGASARAHSGLRLEADVALGDVRAPLDTLIVAGGLAWADAVADLALVAEVRRLSATSRRTASVCTGAFVLAATGLLDGRSATTHWAACRELARRHPAVCVEPDRIYVRDGAVLTSAGVSAGMDLALALVEEDHGPGVAREVARWLVVFLQRPGGQSQFSARLAHPVPARSPLRVLLDAVVADPAGDHDTPALAVRAAVSERHLRRLFAEQAGTTPARFVERVRVEAARALLEQTALPVDAVAARSGLGSAETLRRAFLRVVGVPPSTYRERFRTAVRDDHHLELGSTA